MNWLTSFLRLGKGFHGFGVYFNPIDNQPAIPRLALSACLRGNFGNRYAFLSRLDGLLVEGVLAERGHINRRQAG